MSEDTIKIIFCLTFIVVFVGLWGSCTKWKFGIYGVVSYSVVQRTSEIGVRMALGANAADTVTMIVTQALWVVGIGVVLGVAGAIGAARFIEGLLYGINATDPVTYLAMGGLVIGLGALAAAIPARRATAVDPVLALRKE